MKCKDKLFSLIKSIFLGKPVHESANLEDFKYARWCLYLYIILAGTYWYFEIGIPHWDGPKEDFRQLMEHEALVKLTVVFGAAMGLIALLHRSIVSDYQIKQQGKTDIISNFYKVSEHINSNAASILPNPKRSPISYGSNFPYGIIGNIFRSPSTGDYEVSEELVENLNILTELYYFGERSTLGTFLNPFAEIDAEKSSTYLFFSIIYPLVRSHFLLENHDQKAITTHRSTKLTRAVANILELEFNHYSDDSDENHTKKISDIENITYQWVEIVKSIENLVLTIPIDEQSTRYFFLATKAAKHTAELALKNIRDLLEHISQLKSKEEHERELMQSKTRSFLSTAFVDDTINDNRKVELIFLYCCIKLDLKPILSDSFPLDDFSDFIDNLYPIHGNYLDRIKSYINELSHETANND